MDVTGYISWVDGILMLEGNNLSEITKKLSKYYGISIQCNPEVGKEKVYGKLDIKDKKSSKRGAFLYKFNEKKYNKWVEQGFDFSL